MGMEVQHSCIILIAQNNIQALHQTTQSMDLTVSTWHGLSPLTICCAQLHNRLPSSSAFFLLERVPACQLNLRHTYPTSDKQKE